MNEKIFKAYDIRGIYPGEIDEEAVKRIAKAYVQFIYPEHDRRVKPKTVAVGRDVRLSSPSLQKAVIEGLIESGVDVVDIGMGPTEMIYFAVGAHNYDGAIQVSASHNPAEYNGLKMIREKVQALSSDNGLLEIKELAIAGNFKHVEQKGTVTKKDLTDEYLEFLKKFMPKQAIPSLKIIANNNFGMSGVLAKKFFTKNIPQIELVGLNDKPDGSFPKGRPDPLIPENRQELSELVVSEKANLGVAWDADGDRFYITDEKGLFVEGYYLTALLAEYLLEKDKGGKVIYDPRNIWAIEQTVAEAGGKALLNKAGHTFIKNRMKKEGALFAGEASGHFYFRDFFNADNGLIPLLLVLSIIAETNKSVSELFKNLREKFHVSGEINFKVADISSKLLEMEEIYKEGEIDRTDGLSVSFDNWRFNVRASNTEPLLRLNVEGKSQQIVDEKTAELKSLIGG